MNAASQLYMADLGQRFQVSYMNLAYWICISQLHCITKTSQGNEDPLTPHIYIEKTVVYRGAHYFLIFALKHRLWVPARTASLRRF